MAALPARGRNQQRLDGLPVPQFLRRAGSHTGRIGPMGLRDGLPAAVVFGAPATADLHGQAQGHQPLVERPAGRVHRCRIAQRRLRLCQDARQSHGVMGQEHPDVLRPFLRITRHTRERQIALAAAAPTAAWHDVLDLQRHAARIAVRAAPAPLLQHILLDLKAGQRALLIRHSCDVRILHGLRVEPHQLQRERRDRTEPPQPLDPGQHVLIPAAQRRRQPAVFPAPVVVARLPVAGVPLPAVAAHRSPLAQPLDNLFTAVGQFRSPHHLATRLFHQRQSCRVTSRIDLQRSGSGAACSTGRLRMT